MKTENFRRFESLNVKYFNFNFGLFFLNLILELLFEILDPMTYSAFLLNLKIYLKKNSLKK